MNTQKDTRLNKGGYSGTGMLPIYAVWSTATFLLAPFVGVLLSAVIASFATAAIAYVVRTYVIHIAKVGKKMLHELPLQVNISHDTIKKVYSYKNRLDSSKLKTPSIQRF